jgi:SAM-dependent methyltransferase
MIEKLKLPERRGVQDIDVPQATLLHGEIIKRKPFLKAIYVDFYRELRDGLPRDLEGKVIVELGSGGGFLKEIIPQVITSDVLDLPNVDMHFSATGMPFMNHSVDAFIMIDVLHHINDTRKFFQEIVRCLRNGGKVIMIEPANTLWSRFIYMNFHHEPFEPSAGWGLDGQGPLTSANGAIPWIVFLRDRETFENEFPELTIRKMKLHTPFRYILSGGLTLKQLLPSFFYAIVKFVETLLFPLNPFIGMFMTIVLEKNNIGQEKS